MRLPSSASLFAFVLACACSGQSFQSGSGGHGTGGTASGTGGTSATGGTAATGGSVSSNGGASGGTGTGDGAVACAPLPSTATDVFVDQRFTQGSATGTQTCPFPTILEGLDAASGLTGSVTIHVAGALPPLVYDETGPVLVGANQTLLGDGPAKTTITASGTCGSAQCAMGVDGGIVDGFTVTCPSGNGIVTGTSSSGQTVRNTWALQSSANGVLAMGSVDLGPNFRANRNTAAGVQSPSTATGSLHVVGTTNEFNNNGANGINVDGLVALNFEGGTANGNFQGIRLAGVPGTNVISHVIRALTAGGNTGPGGVVAYNGQTIQMRGSILRGNSGVGLLYTYAGTSTLDIGTSTDTGGNVFAGATALNNNKLAGIRLCNAGGDGSQPAFGDSFSSCAPTQVPLPCDTPITAYADIVFGSPVVGTLAPVVATSCAVGP